MGARIVGVLALAMLPTRLGANLRPAVALAEQAEAYDDAGRFAEAAALYERAISLWPPVDAASGARARMLAALLNNQGVCLLELERLREAEAAFSRGLALHSMDASLHCNHGLALLRIGGTSVILERALASLREAARLDPTDGEAPRLAATVLVSLGRSAEAAGSLESALKLLDPTVAALVFAVSSPDASEESTEWHAYHGSELLPEEPPVGGFQAVDAWLQLAALHAAPAECLHPPSDGVPQFAPSEIKHALALARAGTAAASLKRTGVGSRGASDARALTFQAYDPPHATLRALARVHTRDEEGALDSMADGEVGSAAGAGSDADGFARANVRQLTGGGGGVATDMTAAPDGIRGAWTRKTGAVTTDPAIDCAGAHLGAAQALRGAEEGRTVSRVDYACPRDALELTVNLTASADTKAGVRRDASSKDSAARAAWLLRTHGAVVVLGAALDGGTAPEDVLTRTAPVMGVAQAEEHVIATALRRLAATNGSDATRGLRAREGRMQTTLPCATPAIRRALARLLPILGAHWGSRAAADARVVECALLETKPGAGAQALHRDVRPAVERCDADLLALQILPVETRAKAGVLEVVCGSHRGDGGAATSPQRRVSRGGVHEGASDAGGGATVDACKPLALATPRGAAILYDPRALHRGGAHVGGAPSRLALVVRLLHAEGLPPRDLPYAIELSDVGRHSAGSLAAAADE